MTSIPIQYIQTACQSYVEDRYPNLTPKILSLDTYHVSYLYTSQYPYTVYVRGLNFSANGITSVTLGPYKKIPITFFSSNSISFIIPLNAKSGEYNVQVENTNIYGSLFSNTIILTIEKRE
jgi:hypothetical protein